MTSRMTRKSRIGFLLAGVAALLLAAYTIGSQVADGTAGAKNGSSSAMADGHDGPPGPFGGPGGPNGGLGGANLEQLASKLGVEAGALEQALEEVREQNKPDTNPRRQMETALADALGIEQSKLRAAFKKVHSQMRKQMLERHDAFVAALAKKLGIDESKVKEALPNPPGPGSGKR